VLVVVDKMTVLVWAKAMDDPIKIDKETTAHKMILVPIIRFMFFPPYWNEINVSYPVPFSTPLNWGRKVGFHIYLCQNL
jgi:hypothetical protein